MYVYVCVHSMRVYVYVYEHLKEKYSCKCVSVCVRVSKENKCFSGCTYVNTVFSNRVTVYVYMYDYVLQMCEVFCVELSFTWVLRHTLLWRLPFLVRSTN